MQILANRIREVYAANGLRFRQDGELVNCVLRSRSRVLYIAPHESLGEHWAERFQVSRMISSLWESRS
jgi:hypothetical protein